MGLRLYLRGLGLGIMVTALLMGYTLGNRKETLTDAEIKARAAGLGMVEEGKTLINPSVTGVAKEDEADTEKPDNIDLSEESEDTPAEEPGNDPAYEAQAEENEPVSGEDETVPGEAEEGVNGESVHELNVSGTLDTAEEAPAIPSPLPEETKQETGSVDENPGSEALPAASGTEEKADVFATSKDARITIRSGSDSSEAAKQLERAGVVDSAEKFDEYLISRRIDRFVGAGSFEIPSGADYRRIAQIITGR